MYPLTSAPTCSCILKETKAGLHLTIRFLTLGQLESLVSETRMHYKTFIYDAVETLHKPMKLCGFGHVIITAKNVVTLTQLRNS